MQEQLKDVRLNSEARVSLVHKQMCYLQKGPLDVLRKWMRNANPANIPIDDVEDYFRVVFNDFLSHRKIDFWRRFLALAQQTSCSGSPAVATGAYNMDVAMVAANLELFSQI